jgi:hypothetical protein
MEDFSKFLKKITKNSFSDRGKDRRFKEICSQMYRIVCYADANIVYSNAHFVVHGLSGLSCMKKHTSFFMMYTWWRMNFVSSNSFSFVCFEQGV